METSGIKIDLNSDNLLLDNSEKIQKVIKYAVKQATDKKIAESKSTLQTKTAK